MLKKLLSAELVGQWHPTLNGDLKPTDVSAYSHRLCWWHDKTCGHSWPAQPANRSRGDGCTVCKNKYIVAGINDLPTTDPLIMLDWDWSKNTNLDPSTISAGSDRQACWKCHVCGHEWQTAVSVRKKHGCATCGIKKRSVSRAKPKSGRSLAELRPDLAAQLHPTLNGDLTAVDLNVSANQKVVWSCSSHSPYIAAVKDRTRGTGCPACAKRVVVIGETDLPTTHPLLAAEWHPTRNSKQANEVTAGSGYKAWWQCSRCAHEWQACVYTRTTVGTGCPECALAAHVSKGEAEVAFYLESLGCKIERHNRKVLAGFEIDIYLPELHVGVEFNGVYWHSEERGKSKFYHQDKWLKAKAKGVQLIQVWEDEWRYKTAAVKNELARAVGYPKSSKSVPDNSSSYAIKKITPQAAKEFMIAHTVETLLGKAQCFALYSTVAEEKLVAVLSILKDNHDGLVKLQYAGSAAAPSGLPLLSDHVKKLHPNSLLSLAASNSYPFEPELLTAGFVEVATIEPEFKLAKGLRRIEPSGEAKSINSFSKVWDAGRNLWQK